MVRHGRVAFCLVVLPTAPPARPRADRLWAASQAASSCYGRHHDDRRCCGGASRSIRTPPGSCSAPNARVQRGGFCRCLVARLDPFNGCEMGSGALHARCQWPMSDSNIRVSAILVSYNSKEDLLRNLPSLLEATSREIDEVILVDNDSSDLTSELVPRLFPEVQLIEAGSNLGFGGAVNLAAVQARGRTLLILNPDL